VTATTASSPNSASVLQFHRHLNVLVDEAAATSLHLAGYRCQTYRNKPGRLQL